MEGLFINLIYNSIKKRELKRRAIWAVEALKCSNLGISANMMKRKIYNFYEKRKSMNFNTDLLPKNVLHYLDNLSRNKERSRFIVDAINQRYLYLTNPKQYFKQLIELNFYLIKHLLRKIGRKY